MSPISRQPERKPNDDGAMLYGINADRRLKTDLRVYKFVLSAFFGHNMDSKYIFFPTELTTNVNKIQIFN